MSSIPVLPIKEKRVAQSAAEQYRKALEAAEAIKTQAVDELKGNIQKQIDELNSFGFSFRLTDGNSAGTSKRASGQKRAKAEICGVCNFATTPLHDGRHKLHKAQGDHKKALTAKELQESGLTKVA